MTVSHLLDANTYSREFAESILSSRGCRTPSISITGSDDDDFMHNFYWEYYYNVLMDSGNWQETARSFKLAERRIEGLPCPDWFPAAAIEAASRGGYYYRNEYSDDNVFNFAREYFRDSKSPVESGYIGPIYTLSLNHLATRLEFGGYDFWLTASGFITRLFVGKGLIDWSMIRGHASIGGWVCEHIEIPVLAA